MSQPQIKSIRGLIFNHFFLALTGLFTLFAGITYVTISFYLERLTISSSQAVVANVGVNLRSQLQGRLQNFDTLASLQVLNPPTRVQEAQQTVRSFLKHEQFVSTVHVYRSDGHLLFHAKRENFPDYVPEKSFLEMKPAFVELVQRVLKTKRPQTSEIFSGQRQRNYEVYMVPLFADETQKTVWGVMSAAIFPHATDLSYMLEGLSLSKGNSLLLTDMLGHVVLQNGSVFSDEDKGNVAYRRAWKTELQPRVLRWAAERSPKDGAPFYVQDDSAQPYIAVSRFIPQSKALIHLFIDRRPLREQRKDVLVFVFGCYVLSLLVSVLVAKVLSRRLAGPVEGIAITLAQFRRGNFGFRAPHAERDEFQEIFAALRDLGDKIEREHFIHRLWNPQGPDDEQR